MNKESNNTEVALTGSKSEIQFSNFTSVEQILEFGKTIVKSRLTPLTTPEAVMAAMLMGKELGFGVMASVNNIYPINGVATSGVHIINALILKAGVTYKIINDYTPLYSFTDKKGVVYGEDEVLKRKDLFQVVTSATPSEQIDTSRTVVVRNPRPVDYKTTIELSRQVRQANGEFKEILIIAERSLNDYRHLWDKKDNGGQQKANWLNNMKGMLFNRVMATGGRAIADDALLGLYLTEELSDSKTKNNNEQASTINVVADVLVEDVKDVEVETVKIN